MLLYKLLSERDDAVNISHKAMPCWGDHIRFVESKPYEAWYFIGDEPFGACYLSKLDEIGVFVFRDHRGKGYGRSAIAEIIARHKRPRYLANVNPRNEGSAKLFTGLGFKLCQHTYALSSR